MKSALRRSLEHSGWQLVGFLLGLAVIAGIGWVADRHIEHRIDSVATQGQHDHRAIHKLQVRQAKSRAIAGRHAPSRVPPQGGTHAPTMPSGLGSGGPVAPAKSVGDHHHAPHQRGASQRPGPESAPPAAPPAPVPAQPLLEQPASEGEVTIVPLPAPVMPQPTVEAAGTVLEAATGTVCGLAEPLLATSC